MENVQKSLLHLEKSVARMTCSINALLELSCIDENNSHMELINTNKLISEIFSMHSSQIKNENSQVDIQNNLPPLYGDKKDLFKIFDNLLLNAIYHGSPTQNSEIKIFSKSLPHMDCICLQDFGPGIDKKYHERIFGLFEKLNGDSKGTGIGLSLAAKFMKKHQGKIWVESELGRGAIFCCAFPRHESDELSHQI